MASKITLKNNIDAEFSITHSDEEGAVSLTSTQLKQDKGTIGNGTSFQLRRGIVSENNSFTGAAGEVVVDTTNNRLRVHDGVTTGGFPIGDFVNVLDYGAHPSYTASVNTAAINDALATGLVIDGGGLEFNINPLTISVNDTTLQNIKLNLDDGATASAITITADNVLIKKVKINVPYATMGNVDSAGIFINGASDVIVEKSSFIGAKNYTYTIGQRMGWVYIYNSSNCSILDCKGYTSDKEGFIIDNSSYCKIEGCYGELAGNSNISCSGTGGNHIISNNVSKNSGSSGISVNSNYCTVTGNISDGTTTYNGIQLGHNSDTNNADFSVCDGNTVLNANEYAIASNGSANVVISNNVCNGTIRFQDSPESGTIDGNTVYDGQIYVFNSSGTPTGDYIISNNKVINSSTSGIYAKGANSITVIGNTIRNANRNDSDYTAYIRLESCQLFKADGNTCYVDSASSAIQPRYGIDLPTLSSVTQATITNNYIRNFDTKAMNLIPSIAYTIKGNNISDDSKYAGITLNSGSTSIKLTNGNILAKGALPCVTLGTNVNTTFYINNIVDGSIDINIPSSLGSNAFFRYVIH